MDSKLPAPSLTPSNLNNESVNKSAAKALSECRLWVGNLDSKLREYNLLKMVEKFGPLVEFDFLYHRSGPQNGQPRGYAFVTYRTFEDAQKAQRTMDGLEVRGRKLAVKWAHAQDETKFVGKTKPFPPVLGISKDPPANTTAKKMSKESKIAALEAQLKLLDEKGRDMSFTPDIGGPSKPTTVTYNYIEQRPRNAPPHNLKHNHSSQPYNKKVRRK